MTHLEFLECLLGEEIRCRLDKARERRIREACFPYEKRLENSDLSFCPSLTAKNLRQLGELKWVEQIYNLIFLGPPGVVKQDKAAAQSEPKKPGRKPSIRKQLKEDKEKTKAAPKKQAVKNHKKELEV